MTASEAKVGYEWGEHFDYASLGPNFRIPVFVIQGDNDFDAPIDLARAWFDRIHAPVKGFVAIPGAGDHALQTHSQAFLDALDQKVRPLAAAAADGRSPPR